MQIIDTHTHIYVHIGIHTCVLAYMLILTHSLKACRLPDTQMYIQHIHTENNTNLHKIITFKV